MDSLRATKAASAAEPTVAILSCLTCRGRKVKCDKRHPSCSNCIRLAQLCTYPTQLMKPGPKSKTTSSTLKALRKHPSHEKTGSKRLDKALISHKRSQQEPPTPTVTPSVAATRKIPESPGSQMKPTNTDSNYEEVMKELPCSSPSPDRVSSIFSRFETYPLCIPGLSWIIHPSDYPNSATELDGPNMEGYSRSVHGDHSAYEESEESVFLDTCRALHVTTEAMGNMIDAYFTNMTAFSLFHKPSFDDKLYNISNSNHRNALLAAMFAFSARWASQDQEKNSPHQQQAATSEEYFGLAMRLLHAALEECEFDEPPFHLLQTMVLTTFYQLIKGVRGKAWRYLGTCIRIAYELKLHIIDASEVNLDGTVMGPRDVSIWVADEERRRVWWTLWEFDTFASSIQKAPMVIDAAYNETLLPVDDESWFTHRPTRSCVLELSPTKRWKSLQASGNESAKAWFIVMNSYMRDAQLLSKSPPSVRLDRRQNYSSSLHTSSEPCSDSHYRMDLCRSPAVIANSISCFSIALPPSLTYKYQYLRFSPYERQHDSDLHAIFLITQLSRFMIYNHELFRTRRSHAPFESNRLFKGESSSSSNIKSQATSSDRSSGSISENNSWRNYLDAADSILHMLRNTSADHIKYVNPFVSCTVWIAAAVLVVNKVFGPPGPQTSINESKIDLLRSNFNQYLRFWDTSPGLRHKLDTIEKQLGRMFSQGVGPSGPFSNNNINISGGISVKSASVTVPSSTLEKNTYPNKGDEEALTTNNNEIELMPGNTSPIRAVQDDLHIQSQQSSQRQETAASLANDSARWLGGYENFTYNGMDTAIPTADSLGEFASGGAEQANSELQHYLNNVLAVSSMDIKSLQSFKS